MSDFLTRLVQRSLGSVPMVRPRIPSSFAPGNELSKPAISSVGEPDSDPIEIDVRQDSMRHDSESTFDGHQVLSETQNAADAGHGEGIRRTSAIKRESDQDAGDGARSANRLAESSGGVGGFLMRLFKPKTADVVQLKQGLPDGSSAIQSTVTAHLPAGGDVVLHQPERGTGLSETTTADPAYPMQVTPFQPGSNSSSRAVVSGSRPFVNQKGLPLSEDAASDLYAIQGHDSEGSPQYSVAHNIVPDTLDIPDLMEQTGPEAGAVHSVQPLPGSKHVFETASQNSESHDFVAHDIAPGTLDITEQTGPGVGAVHSVQPLPGSKRVFEMASQRSESHVVGDPAKQASIASAYEKKPALTQGPAQDKPDQQDLSVTPIHPQAESPGLPETDGSKVISPQVMVPDISEPQFVRDGRLTEIKSPTIEVAIDRIEVRAATPPVRPRRARSGPALSLNEYLNRRGRRQQ